MERSVTSVLTEGRGRGGSRAMQSWIVVGRRSFLLLPEPLVSLVYPMWWGGQSSSKVPSIRPVV